MSIVHEHHVAFDDRNLFLQVLLGLVSYARRYETLLAAAGPARAPARPDAFRPDPVLDAALGLTVLASHVLETLAAAGEVPPERPARTPDAALRRLLD